MNENIKIAWRNLWRNKRRTIITISSIFFAILFAIIMRSFQLGTYQHMIKQSIESYTGYLQIQHPDYSDDPSLDNAFEYTKEIEADINACSNIKVAVPRIESFALASNGAHTKGVLVCGIQPKLENEFSNPEHKLVRYRFTAEAIKEIESEVELPKSVKSFLENNLNQSFSSEAGIELMLALSKEQIKTALPIIEKHSKVAANYLSETDDGVLISDRLSKYMSLTMGDTLILISQGYHGISAAGLFPVRGIVKIPSPDLDNKLVYMTIERANDFFDLNNNITSIAINLKNIDLMEETQTELKSKIDKNSGVVKNWYEITPILKQQIESDNKSGQIFLAVLYLIIFFGIFGTVMMMVAERQHEFGVMIAIGMKKSKLAIIVSLEMLFLGLIGIISGMAASAPLIIAGHYNPIKITGDLAKMYEDMGFDPVMPLAWFGNYFYVQGVVVIVMILFASWIPIRSIIKMNVIKALRG